LDDNDVYINKGWESFRDNTKASATDGLGYYELKQQKPWFDTVWAELLDQRKQAKLQWLQNPSWTNGDNRNNVRREKGRTFGNRKRNYLKEKLNEHQRNSNNKNKW